MKLLVVSWGNFERWTETKYRLGHETATGPSTLPILQKVIMPDWTVIVLPDTLGRDFSSVEALRDDVRFRVMDYLERIGAGREMDIVIAPGIGAFPHGSFKGNAMDGYYYVLHSLSQIIPPNEPLDVHFDATHGLNYVTLLTYRALKDLLGIAAIGNDVSLTVYNSDPLVPGIMKELTINVIEKAEISASPVGTLAPSRNEVLGPHTWNVDDYVSIQNKNRVFSTIKTLKSSLDLWIGAVLLGLPLLFAENFPDSTLLEDVIQEILSIWESAISVSEGHVERGLLLKEGFGTLVKVWFQVEALSKYRVELPPTLDELYLIADGVFRGSTRERTRVELGRIEDAAIKWIASRGTVEWLPLRDFLGFDRANRTITPRNFLAHAGLESNSVEVKIEGGGNDPKHEARKLTRLRYSQDSRRAIRRIISSSLRE